MGTPAPRLFADPESVRLIRSTLEQYGFDLAHEAIRPDYLTSPFPKLEFLIPRLNRLDPTLEFLFRLYTAGESFTPDVIEAVLGREMLEANLVTGLLRFDAAGTLLSTGGLQLVSRLGQYFIVSTSRAYPAFDPDMADIYLGPESYTLANYLQRRAGKLPSSGAALDLCTGSGIAAQSLAAVRRGVVWKGVDLSGQAVEAANVNALLNETADRYTAVTGDLYQPLDGQRFGLIVANPPFIPVPQEIDFPVYGDGGEDGLLVLGPMISGLAAHLLPSGRAVIYAEGIGNEHGPLVLSLLERAAADGLTIGMTILSSITIEQALFTIGRMLSAQIPSRIDQLAAWHELFTIQGATRYDKFLIEARFGEPAVIVRSLEAL